MFSKAEWLARGHRVHPLHLLHPLPALQRLGRLVSGLTLVAALTACGTGRPNTAPAPFGTAAFPELLQSSQTPDPAMALAPAPPHPAPASEPVVQLLAYADQVRAMSGPELSQEVTRLGTPYAPADQLKLALILSQLRQTAELVRAQEWLSRLLANTDSEAQRLHPLARLLAARYAEQRRLEDLLDKQSQQTRDAQRKLDQTNERLEALKAIERSLTRRAPAPAATLPPAGKHTP